MGGKFGSILAASSLHGSVLALAKLFLLHAIFSATTPMSFPCPLPHHGFSPLNPAHIFLRLFFFFIIIFLCYVSSVP